MFFFHSDHWMTMNLAKEAAAHALSFQTSEAGRHYKHGASYGVMERLEIVEIYFQMTTANGTPVDQRGRERSEGVLESGQEGCGGV